MCLLLVYVNTFKNVLLLFTILESVKTAEDNCFLLPLLTDRVIFFKWGTVVSLTAFWRQYSCQVSGKNFTFFHPPSGLLAKCTVVYVSVSHNAVFPLFLFKQNCFHPLSGTFQCAFSLVTYSLTVSFSCIYYY